jgi:hypothetical protein
VVRTIRFRWKDAYVCQAKSPRWYKTRRRLQLKLSNRHDQQRYAFSFVFNYTWLRSNNDRPYICAGLEQVAGAVNGIHLRHWSKSIHFYRYFSIVFPVVGTCNPILGWHWDAHHQWVPLFLNSKYLLTTLSWELIYDHSRPWVIFVVDIVFVYATGTLFLQLLGTTIKNFVLQGDAAIDNCASVSTNRLIGTLNWSQTTLCRIFVDSAYSYRIWPSSKWWWLILIN